MTSPDGSGFRLNVLNPGGRDPEQYFREGATPNLSAHAPVNFHAYAACTGGSFLREAKRAAEVRQPVLLLLRGDFKDSERALFFLKKAGMTVAVSLKETGLHQIANQLGDHGRLSRFTRIIQDADGWIASTPEAADFFRTIAAKNAPVGFIPTPYPLHDANWDLSRPIEERHGILIGTREWDIPSRNHHVALTAAREISEATGEPVTVYNFDGRKGDRLLALIGFREMRTLKETDDYREYLRSVAAHKIIFQLDTSFVPGQVAGDALLCRIPCVGGNGAIDRIAFPDLCGANQSIARLIEIATSLLKDQNAYRAAIEASQARAAEHLSFARIGHELQEFFAKITR